MLLLLILLCRVISLTFGLLLNVHLYFFFFFLTLTSHLVDEHPHLTLVFWFISKLELGGAPGGIFFFYSVKLPSMTAWARFWFGLKRHQTHFFFWIH